MEQFNTLIEKQYHSPGLYEGILSRLKEQKVNLKHVSRSHIAGVDEFHVRGAEVSKELAQEIDLTNATVLDIGCGIGGPSRMLADEYDCSVTGIDICPDYIRTAQKLSELVGFNGSTKFIEADALNLPFEDGSFDVVWTQHVQMNVRDKTRFYSEINRVLSDRGTFIYYDIFKTNGQDVNYPVPWANDPSISFLGSIPAFYDILSELGLTRVITTNQTAKATQFLVDLFNKVKKSGPPKMGLNVLMGNTTGEKLGNILLGLKENKIVLQSGIYIKNL
ncbi:MAG: class I SAM-dependent methyltransferase [Bacteroidota bacterium]